MFYRLRIAFLAATKASALLLVMLAPVWLVLAVVSLISMRDFMLAAAMFGLGIRIALLLWGWLFLFYLVTGAPAWLMDR